jgi:3'-5' exoribonuclease
VKLTNISNFKLGHSIKGFYLCREKHILYTRNDDPYLDLVLTDASGSIAGKMWEMVNEFDNRFENGDPVAVKGKVSEFNKKLQIIITNINRASSSQYGKYGFSPEKLVPHVNESVTDLWKQLIKTSKSINSPLKDLVINILNEHKSKILIMPYSIYHHHPLSGSFLKHLVTTTEIVKNILPHYYNLNRDLTLAGIILYDIGKVKGINDDLLPKQTDEGKLLGNMVLGRDIIIDAAQSIKNFPSDILAKLEHIILSHHGESGNNVVTIPKFPEALCINCIGNLDGRLNVMLDIIKDDPNQDWTSFQSKYNTEFLKK